MFLEKSKSTAFKKILFHLISLIVPFVILLLLALQYFVREIFSKKPAPPLQKEVNNPGIALAETLGHILTSLKQRICAHGIFLNVKIPEHLCIYAKREDASQIFYGILANQVERLKEKSESRELVIRAEATKTNVILTINDNGPLYEQLIIDNFKKESPGREIPSNLLIAKDLMRESQAGITLSNTTAGPLFTIIFKRIRSAQKLNRIFKGTKRSLREEISRVAGL